MNVTAVHAIMATTTPVRPWPVVARSMPKAAAVEKPKYSSVDAKGNAIGKTRFDHAAVALTSTSPPSRRLAAAPFIPNNGTKTIERNTVTTAA